MTARIVRELPLRKCIRSIGAPNLEAHTGLEVACEAGQWRVVCSVCGSRWLVNFSQVATGDGYCEHGATNYYDSLGKLTRRV